MFKASFVDTKGYSQAPILFKQWFVFVFSGFFWGEGIFFYLTITECEWNIGNAGETSAMRVKWSWNVHAGESLEMQVTPAQCGWVHISVYLKFIRFSPILRNFAPLLTQPLGHTTKLENIFHQSYNHSL